MSHTDEEQATDKRQESIKQQLDRVDENVTGLFAKVSELLDRVDELEAKQSVLEQHLDDGGEDS